MTPDALAATHRAANLSDRAWSAQEFASLLAGHSTVLVGDAKSFVLARVIGDEAEILTVATHPDAQRQGRARAALTALHDIARQKAVQSIFLEVAADNDPAHALYAKAGYTAVGRRAAYYTRPGGVAVDAIVLRRDMTQG